MEIPFSLLLDLIACHQIKHEGWQPVHADADEDDLMSLLSVR